MILFLTSSYFSNWVEIFKPGLLVRKGESGTNNLLDQQISANLQRLLVWHSGDYDGLQSQRSRVQIQVSAKEIKNLGGSMGLGLGMGVNRVRDRDGVRTGSGVLFFLRNTPSPQKSGKLPGWKKLTS